jgi:hypothetical protein
MRKRGLTRAARSAILFGAVMLATRADAVTVAVPSGLRAAAATTDLSRPVQYYCGWGCDPCWGSGGYGGYGYGGYGGYGYGGYGGYYRSYYGYAGYPYAGPGWGWGYRRGWW